MPSNLSLLSCCPSAVDPIQPPVTTCATQRIGRSNCLAKPIFIKCDAANVANYLNISLSLAAKDALFQGHLNNLLPNNAATKVINTWHTPYNRLTLPEQAVSYEETAEKAVNCVSTTTPVYGAATMTYEMAASWDVTYTPTTAITTDYGEAIWANQIAEQGASLLPFGITCNGNLVAFLDPNVNMIGGTQYATNVVTATPLQRVIRNRCVVVWVLSVHFPYGYQVSYPIMNLNRTPAVPVYTRLISDIIK